MSTLRALATMICLATLPALPAVGQGAGFDPTGDWRFEADDCRGDAGSLTPLSGRMTISRSGDGLSARFFIRQGDASAVQTATVAQEGDRLRITSEIVRAWTEGGYYPDNFDVTAVGPNRMEGTLLSIVTCDAVFERTDPLPGLV